MTHITLPSSLGSTLPLTGIISCSISGVTCSYSIPSLSLLPLNESWSCPIGNVKTALSYAFLPIKQLESLDTEILAGAILTIYNHHNLFITKDTAIISNAVLRTCSIESLLNALLLSAKFTKKNVESLPQLRIDLASHTEVISKDTTFTMQLDTFVKTIRELVFTPIASTSATNGIVTIKRHSFDEQSTTYHGAYSKISSNTKSDYEKELNKEFTEDRAVAVEALKIVRFPLIALGYVKLVSFVTSVTKGTTILQVPEASIEKLLTRLSEVAIDIPAEQSLLIQDIIAFVETAKSLSIESKAKTKLESALERATPVVKKLSLKELIEHKLLAESNKASSKGEL